MCVLRSVELGGEDGGRWKLSCRDDGTKASHIFADPVTRQSFSLNRSAGQRMRITNLSCLLSSTLFVLGIGYRLSRCRHVLCHQNSCVRSGRKKNIEYTQDRSSCHRHRMHARTKQTHTRVFLLLLAIWNIYYHTFKGQGYPNGFGGGFFRLFEETTLKVAIKAAGNPGRRCAAIVIVSLISAWQLRSANTGACPCRCVKLCTRGIQPRPGHLITARTGTAPTPVSKHPFRSKCAFRETTLKKKKRKKERVLGEKVKMYKVCFNPDLGKSLVIQRKGTSAHARQTEKKEKGKVNKVVNLIAGLRRQNWRGQRQ